MGARVMHPAGAGRRLELAIRHVAGTDRAVLAVSGGRDSMVLLHAASRVVSPASAVVATFDHGTGTAATHAAHFVARQAGRLGFTVVIGRAASNPGTEAGWRAERHRFLRDVASGFGGRVMTAHSRDDQVETVLMRVLRDTGARGLAGLYAESEFLRPLLGFSRDEIGEYATRQQVSWVEDPTNASPAHLRNRVRRDLLPALHRVAPGLDAALLEAARRAAGLRASVDAWVAERATIGASRVSIPARDLEGYGDAELALIWPALAAQIGVAMDWRGIGRAAAFTQVARVGSSVPLSGGWSITRSRDHFDLHPVVPPPAEHAPLQPGLRWMQWRFEATAEPFDASNPWMALVPASGPDGELVVRAWRAGDRMLAGGVRRRVKRYLSDAGVTGERRARWPVVLKGDDIVWIPGVRRSDAASVRPGRPGMLYRCDDDRR